MAAGRWPNHEIDHRNGIKNDDRWNNLRDATHAVNMQNIRRALKSNGHGHLGATRNGSGYLAQIVVKGKYLYLGTFRTPELANGAYLKAKRELHEGCTI